MCKDICIASKAMGDYGIELDNDSCSVCSNLNNCFYWEGAKREKENIENRKQITITHNGILFRGRYAIALISLIEGKTVNMYCFYNGSYEPTSKLKIFINKLEEAKIPFEIEGKSLRKMNIILK